MIERPFWISRIEQAWQDAPIVWLAGVRRSGKTTLALSLGSERAQYINCDLPVVSEMVADPELFYRNCTRPVVVFDEIHQLEDPSRLLKIGADRFPQLKILATGSSTLAATRKFRDSLTGRKRVVHLTPVAWDEIEAFNHTPLLKRLFHGGLPQALLAPAKSPAFYREWIESFYALDIQRLFGFRDANKFSALFEYLLRQSSGMMEIARTARAMKISRPTVESYLNALQATHVMTLVRPFHGGGQRELIKMPKVYGFDTGFVGFCRGWDPLRPDDYGVLWEHLVLEYLLAKAGGCEVRFWRDTGGKEIDFVISSGCDEVDAIECKWNPEHFDPSALGVFRTYYPKGRNFLVTPGAGEGYWRRGGGMKIRVCTPEGWLAADAVKAYRH